MSHQYVNKCHKRLINALKNDLVQIFLVFYSIYTSQAALCVFKLPLKLGIQKFVQNTLERLSVSTTAARRAEYPILNVTPESNTAIPMLNQLQLAIEKGLAKSPMPSGSANNLHLVLKREMALYESGGALVVNLNIMYKFLLAIPPTSVDSVRGFSAAGILCTKFRSRLNADTVDTLCYLGGFFHQQSKPR